MSSETYSKFYNKPESFNLQNSHFAPKNYPNPNNFYEKPQEFRPRNPYDESEPKHIQSSQPSQSSVQPPLEYPKEESLRI